MENSAPLNGQKARDAAGAAVGVSGYSLDCATKVLKNGTPELVKTVDDGRMAVSTAAVHASEPADEQKRILESGRHNRKYKPGLGGGHDVAEKDETPDTEPNGKVRGIEIQRAHEAIAGLKRIPKNDALRTRGFQVVTDWIRHNK